MTLKAVRGGEVVFEILGAGGVALSPEEQVAAAAFLRAAALEIRCEYGPLVFRAEGLSHLPVRWVQRAGVYSALLVHPANSARPKPFEVVPGSPCRVSIPFASR